MDAFYTPSRLARLAEARGVSLSELGRRGAAKSSALRRRRWPVKLTAAYRQKVRESWWNSD